MKTHVILFMPIVSTESLLVVPVSSIDQSASIVGGRRRLLNWCVKRTIAHNEYISDRVVLKLVCDPVIEIP